MEYGAAILAARNRLAKLAENTLYFLMYNLNLLEINIISPNWFPE